MAQKDLAEISRKLAEQEEKGFSPRACPHGAARRRADDPRAEMGHRTPFAVDADRILHSASFTRYIDKTQVFSLVESDRITHRVLHVQLVSKIARTIARLLRLNQDLVEAIALGHDIGHPPFGHDGEEFLSRKCREHGLPAFRHNLQSFRFLDVVERGGRGLNLTCQVLDGVLCHDGEKHTSGIAPAGTRDFNALDEALTDKEKNPSLDLVPGTLEGCLVRLADSIAYVGRDLEDAIALGLVRREDIPTAAARELGETNGTMVFRLVEDLALNSLDTPGVGFSPRVGEALAELKQFNLVNIYLHPAIKAEHEKIKKVFDHLFEAFLVQVKSGDQDTLIWYEYLCDMSEDYISATPPAQVVRDFMASMTDDHLLRTYRDMMLPSRLPGRFN